MAPAEIDLTMFLPNQLVSKDDAGKHVKVSTRDAIKDKYIGLYFSAHWCPPCRNFTPVLAQAYSDLQKKDVSFEVVFVSADQNEDEWKEYFGDMPWLALPFDAGSDKQRLQRHFKVTGLPTLVMVGPDGQVVSHNARSKVLSAPDEFPWVGKPQVMGWDTETLRNAGVWLLMLVWMLYRVYCWTTAGNIDPLDADTDA